MARLRKTFAVSIICLAFLFQALVPFFALYSTPASAPEASYRSLGGKVLICTAQGFTWVSLVDLDANHKNDLPAPHPSYECGLCFLASKTKATVSNFSAYQSVQPAHRVIVYSSLYDRLLARDLHWLPLPRDPPTIAA